MITTEMATTLTILDGRYRYLLKDPRVHITEANIPMPINEILFGRAPDYTITLLASLAARSAWLFCRYIITGRANLYIVDIKTRRGIEEHCILEFNNEFCDNNLRKWVNKDELNKTGNYIFRRRLSLYEIIGRAIVGFILSPFQRKTYNTRRR